MRVATRAGRLGLIVAFLMTAFATSARADQRADAEAQVEFGMALAKSGLWTVAVTHWQKAVKIDDTYAAAWNNLAIGYEQLGKFAEAREAYETALKLDPGNNYIRHNYDQFRELYDRQNRRRVGG